MKSPAVRSYRMKTRAESATRTADSILKAAVDLWRDQPMDAITLDAIADRAGVSVRTVIRRFGSRDGVITACIEADAGGIRKERDEAPVGDIDGALDNLLAHYERDGDAVLRTLALEETLPVARAVAERGRRYHREGCERIFAPFLPRRKGPKREARVDAFVAATDLYVWKLFRRDLGRSLKDTRRAMRTLLEALVKA